MQDLFGLVKSEKAIELLRTLEPPEGYFVAFSGGKDSQALLELVRMAGVKHEAHYHITTVDPPELIQFIRKQYPSVKFDRPRKTMWQLIESQGMPPTRIQRYCCRELKEGGGDGRVVLTGVRADESVMRQKRCQMVNPCKVRGRYLIHPILWWTEDDVWAFLSERGLPHCSLYDEGFRRLGCIGCPMAGPKGQAREFARWPKFRDAYLRAFKRMLVSRERRGVGPFKHGKTPEEVMKWWLNRTRPQETDDVPLFS